MDSQLLEQGRQYMREGCHTLAYHSFVLAIRDLESASQEDIIFVSESLVECADRIENPAMRYEAKMTCQHFDFTGGYNGITS